VCGIVISWDGLPQYAARLIKEFLKSDYRNISIIGTKPVVPIKGMEEIIGQEIFWINKDQKILTWELLNLPVPGIFIQAGWSVKPFINLADEVRYERGKIIALADNDFRGNIRQFFGAVRFRLFLRRKINGIIVPGISGKRLMKYYGMPEEKLRTGMYGADPALFSNGLELIKRPKEILFVGQFIKRKGVLYLCNAFLRLYRQNPGWRLRLCGSGELKSQIPESPGIVVEEFVQPERLSDIYRNARFFILPSSRESWGLVVHEAALSGCALLLSSKVGSIPDLANSKNSIIFRPKNENEIYKSLNRAVEWREDQYIAAQNASLELAGRFGPLTFANSLKELISIVSNDECSV
jgi:glycosyltransferase involved in cell wall biosynthesis